jgi:hypothetical protein
MKFWFLFLFHNSQAFYIHQQQRLSYQCTQLVPRDIVFDAGQIEITRVLGKIDVVVDKQTLEDAKRELEKTGDKSDRLRSLDDISGRATSVRVFEGTPGTSLSLLSPLNPHRYSDSDPCASLSHSTYSRR